MSSPNFFSDGANPNRRDTSYEVLQKILGAITDIPTGNANWTMASLRIGSAGTLSATTANTLDLASGSTGQSIHIYNIAGTNYERAIIGWGSTANELVIGTQKGGTGFGRTLSLMSDNSRRWQIPSSGNFIAAVDNSCTIGLAGASRPAGIYLGSTGITHGATTLLTTSVALTNGAGASAGTLANAPVAGNPTKWVPINDNGVTRYIPCW